MIEKTTEWVKFNDFGYESYRIEYKEDDGRYYQRHVWRTISGAIEVEEWTRTYTIKE